MDDDLRERRFPLDTPSRQPRYLGEDFRLRGPEALRPRLATGLPICDGRQLIGVCERIQLSAAGHSERAHSIWQLLHFSRKATQRKTFFDTRQELTTFVASHRLSAAPSVHDADRKVFQAQKFFIGRMRGLISRQESLQLGYCEVSTRSRRDVQILAERTRGHEI